MRNQIRQWVLLISCLTVIVPVIGQSLSFKTYTNPVIPGDHSDPTMTHVGKYFYTTGSSFNPTPVIYRSTDMVHWEVIAQPVSSDWASYEDKPVGGIWGGHLVYHLNKYWDFFGHWGTIYFTTATSPEGPWSAPIQMNKPASVPSLGQDNSIFIDDDNKWYVLVKAGQDNNWIVELGADGQPAGQVLNLTWLNPAPKYPYGWAEGPVMAKYNGYYFYYVSQSAGEREFVFRSSVLSQNQTDWTYMGEVLDPATKSASWFQGTAHNSVPIMSTDNTFWAISHSWMQNNGNNEWLGQGRQGVLSQIKWKATNFPYGDFPTTDARTAPNLPSSGIPWMVPRSDFFADTKLNPEWSFLGYTPKTLYSLTERPGWLRLRPSTKARTVIKNDGEHAYTLITKLDFAPTDSTHEAGLRIITGNEDLYVKLCSSFKNGNKVIRFTFDKIYYQTPNSAGNVVWLKIQRETHILKAYFSADGISWNQVGSDVNVAAMDKEQHDFNSWTGNRQGLYVQGKLADFDLYIYRDAYSNMLADCPANQYGTKRTAITATTGVLDYIHNNDWAMYAGVEFGNPDYVRTVKKLELSASCGDVDGNVEVWLDSIDTGNKIADCAMTNTGGLAVYKTFTAPITSSVTGRHDVYLRFTGSGIAMLFRLQSLKFISDETTSVSQINSNELKIKLYPNPALEFFNIKTPDNNIEAKLSIFDVNGKLRIQKTIYASDSQVNVSGLSHGVYTVRVVAQNGTTVKKLVVMANQK